MEFSIRHCDRSHLEDDTRVKRVRVIVNPHGGKGDAQQVFNTRILPLLQLAGVQCDLEITKYYGIPFSPRFHPQPTQRTWRSRTSPTSTRAFSSSREMDS